MNTAGRKTVECVKCGCIWAPIGDGNPSRCRRCKTKSWNGPQPHGLLKKNDYEVAGGVASINISTKRRGNVRVLVDVSDLPLVFDGNGGWGPVKCGKNGALYAARKRLSDRKMEYMHRLILGLGGREDGIVDHANRNGLDNRRCNIRRCTQSDNMANRIKGPKAMHSVYKGVTQFRRPGQWLAAIKVRGRRISLGVYDDEVDAARAYDAAALLHFGRFARPNFPQSQVSR